ncbi:hypothetical protein XENOCAPTIV_018006, partial [Xenoophorus captivus]
LQPNSASGSGALEHDPSSIYLRVPVGEAIPGPLPLGVSVIDASVALFGVVFPHVSFKHRLQMLDHFAECIKQAKGVRQQAVQLNIFTAVLSALKGLAENKSTLGPEEVRKSALALVMGALDNPNPILRCAAGEALGRMAQVVGEATFIARMAQTSFDKTGHSLALGCLHRYVGGIGSGQHLKTSVSILLALAQDGSSHEVQDHSDSLVQAAAISCLQQLHMFAPRHVNLSSLVPCLCVSEIQVLHHRRVQVALVSVVISHCAVGFLQVHLCSSHLLLRRAAVACLRQLAQREAAEVCEYAMSLAKKAGDGKDNTTINVGGAVVFEVEKDEEDSEKKDEMDDDTMFTGLGDDDKSKPSVAPRWVTRVFAADCLCRIILLCENVDKAHFDLATARSAQAKNPKGTILLCCWCFLAS